MVKLVRIEVQAARAGPRWIPTRIVSDQYGCFVAGGRQTELTDADQCTEIDFQTGARDAFAMKGMNICSDLPIIDDCIMKDAIAVAQKASEAIGVYVRVDLFLGNNGHIYLQEFSTNHMNGLRHCSAVKDEDGCIDPCFQGVMWKNASDESYLFGGPQTAIPDALSNWLEIKDVNGQCKDIESTVLSSLVASSCTSSNPTTQMPVQITLKPSAAPVAPVNYPSGPYISASKANELIKIPDPPVPENLSRSSCPHLEGDLPEWHVSSTRGGLVTPTSGDVILPDNSRVIVRQSVNGTLGVVTIPPSSEFDEGDSGITFDAHGIDVQGKLTIGSETCRVQTPVTITLDGDRPDDIVTNPRPTTYKGISVTSSISMHGRRFYRTWTRLALTVEPGDDVIMLQHEVNWLPGQEVILVTTAIKDSREWHRNEIAIVKSVAPNAVTGIGAAVTLEKPVTYQHIANNGYQGEVGLLTRMVKVQGSLASEASDTDPLDCRLSSWKYGDFGRPCGNTQLTGFGGHIIVHGSGKGYVEGVELYRMGQTNVMGRYPMHFHLLGDKCTDCFFRGSSVHKSYYRCISIYGTQYTQVSENVAFDVMGFCYYLEDGVEHHNRIQYNLGAHIHLIGPEPPSGDGQATETYKQSVNLTLPADVTASAFYTTNVENYIIGNSASGGWAAFAFPNLKTPLGPHRDVPLRPSSVQALTIDGNTAYSTAWWWYHAAAFYWGGSLYYDDEDTLVYNPGRDQSNNRDTCLVNKCETTQRKDCGATCQDYEQAWLQVSNSKAYLAAGVGFGSWSGRFDGCYRLGKSRCGPRSGIALKWWFLDQQYAQCVSYADCNHHARSSQRKIYPSQWIQVVRHQSGSHHHKLYIPQLWVSLR
jgi:hypothetical protein